VATLTKDSQSILEKIGLEVEKFEKPQHSPQSSPKKIEQSIMPKNLFPIEPQVVQTQTDSGPIIPPKK